MGRGSYEYPKEKEHLRRLTMMRPQGEMAAEQFDRGVADDEFSSGLFPSPDTIQADIDLFIESLDE